jgi:uncharacterized protein YecT (DUF1311 family)
MNRFPEVQIVHPWIEPYSSRSIISPFRSLLVAFAVLVASKPAASMEFRAYYQPQLGINVLIAEGPIVDGDASRFLEAVPSADRDEEGHIVLVLNSLGGSVAAAFELVEAMDRVGVFTLVPDNALCASACASIVYPSGIRRDVVGTGRLGFHSCYSKVASKAEESSLCNELIAEHAVSRGIAHASVNLFVDDFGAHEMAWLDRALACSMLIGMCRPTLRERASSIDAEVKPSFDCGRARTVVENLICANPRLARLDVRMAIAFFALREKSDVGRQLVDDQRAWLREERNKCESLDCLVRAYTERIRSLESGIY